MKVSPLPKTLHPRRIAQSGALIEGSLVVAKMSNLCDVLSDSDGILNVGLSASKDEQHRVHIHGDIDGSVWLTCQLCLKPMQHSLNHHFDLLVVLTDEQAQQVVKNHEPLIVEDDTIEIMKVVEEEVLLSLPLAPVHETKLMCQEHQSFIPLTEEVDEKRWNDQEQPMIQPFTNLKALLSGHKTDDSQQ
ncbi:MAG: hypothetical protein COW84_09700 [Gammaproteobacteria bacterium CG22_combo_CG10-13_8_21_14_all_40_8]|nr:MAG: hypothetical protein COW84_09700 [Gammaproteobacteria bacterium CG22_combo_CG10-13_8_21_14_all_40_8]